MTDAVDPARSAPARWVVVVPVRPAGKSRLGATPEFARAIALDTIEAVVRASRVSVVIVPTADAVLAEMLRTDAAVRVVVEPEPAGIAAAIALALTDVAVSAPRAVLLGDLPALDPGELDDALRGAADVDRGFVADADGTGTSLVTARPGVELVSAFGPDSAARHRGLGLVALDVPSGSTLRHDVDTLEQLADAAALGLGPRTRAFL